MSSAGKYGCAKTERLYAHVLQILSPGEALELHAHVSACSECQAELEALHPVADALATWPYELPSASPPLWERLTGRIADETREAALLAPQTPAYWEEPEWEEVAPGISCKLLATHAETNAVSMLVRLAPGVEYPAHTHAALEELFLLDGELWIDDKKLYPGDYNRAEAGTCDARVWSETGCTCVLVTSSLDVLS